MIEPGRKRRMTGILVSGLAVAAVAGVAIAGTAMARSGRPDVAVAGGGPATPVLQTPATPSAAGNRLYLRRGKSRPLRTPRICADPGAEQQGRA